MSLEVALAENTAAIRELIATLAKSPVAAAPKAEKKAAEKNPPPASEQTGAVQTAEPTPSAATQVAESGEGAPVAQEAAAAPQTTEPTVTAEEATDLLKKVVAKSGREAAVAIFEKFGVAKLGQLPADKLGAFAAEARKVLA